MKQRAQPLSIVVREVEVGFYRYSRLVSKLWKMGLGLKTHLNLLGL